MPRFTIYMYTNRTNGRRYVGVTSCSVEKRWGEHRHAARTGSECAFHRAIRKHGESSFSREILDVLTTPQGAARAETLWITAKQSHTTCGGYNETNGGQGVFGLSDAARQRIKDSHRATGHKPTRQAIEKSADLRRGKPQSEATRTKRSESLKGRGRPADVRAKISASHRGLTASEETRAKLRESHLGKRPSEETRQKLRDAYARRLASGAMYTPEIRQRISDGRRRVNAEKAQTKALA